MKKQVKNLGYETNLISEYVFIKLSYLQLENSRIYCSMVYKRNTAHSAKYFTKKVILNICVFNSIAI